MEYTIFQLRHDICKQGQYVHACYPISAVPTKKTHYIGIFVTCLAYLMQFFGCCCIFVIPTRIHRLCVMQMSQEDSASTATVVFNS